MGTTLKPAKIDPSFFAPRDDTVVTWLGMAGALINTRGTILFIDPLLAVTRRDGKEFADSGDRLIIPLPIEAGEVPRADAVLYTHADGDHFGPATALDLAARLKPQFVAPQRVLRLIEALGIGQERLVTASEGQSIRIGSAEVIVTPALHDYEQPEPFRREDCCGYLIKTPDGAIWHPGDTRLIDDLLAIKEVDVLFFDVAAVEAHLGPEGSARLAQSSGAQVMVAYHYGTFDLPPGTWGSCDPEDARPYISGLAAHFWLPNPGELLHLPLCEAR